MVRISRSPFWFCGTLSCRFPLALGPYLSVSLPNVRLVICLYPVHTVVVYPRIVIIHVWS